MTDNEGMSKDEMIQLLCEVADRAEAAGRFSDVADLEQVIYFLQGGTA